jgi:hypothetical protein
MWSDEPTAEECKSKSARQTHEHRLLEVLHRGDEDAIENGGPDHPREGVQQARRT